MPLYKQSESKKQDIGSNYIESGTPKELDNFEINIEVGGESEASNCCSGPGINGSGVISTDGCITGNGSALTPVTLLIDPSGGLQCGVSGLKLKSAGCCDVNSYVAGNLPISTPTSPQEPATNPVSGTVQEEVFNNGIIYWFYDGSSWSIDKQVSFGSGVGASGISFSGVHTEIYCETLGTGTIGVSGLVPTTPVSPLNSDRDIVIQTYDNGIAIWKSNGASYEVCTSRKLCSIYGFELGKNGTVSTDSGTIDDQHKRPFSLKEKAEIYDATAVLASAATGNTTFEVYTYSAGGSPTLEGMFTIPSGQTTLSLSGLAGTSIDPGGSIAEIVTGGSDGQDLNITIWVESCRI